MAVASDSTLAPESGAHHRTRRAIEAYIEEMIALLDDIDDDPDLEPDDDREPSLGWTGAGQGQAVTLAALGEHDLELDCDTEEGDAGSGTVDDEPMLGWSEARHAQGHCTGDIVVSLDDEETAPESRGAGFRRAGPDDHEDDDPAEDGDDAEARLDEDSEGEFHGGALVGADEPEIYADEPSQWGRA